MTEEGRMRVGMIGINYKSSDLVLRELLARTSQKHLTYDHWEKTDFFYVFLYTCNRTEIYFSAPDLAEAHSELLSVLRQDVFVPFEHKMYSYFGAECFGHLAKVTSGFDSVIFGETEIQRQVKEAYELACLYQTLPSSMHFMFQKSLKIGKEIRTAFILPKDNVSIESAVSELMRCFFSDFSRLSVLFVGHSEINRKILPYIRNKGVSNLYLATRSFPSAKELMVKNDLKPMPWEELERWTEFDVVICGTHSTDYLIRSEHMSHACEIKNRLAIDLCMPRNVDPYLAKHPQITLFNIEELGHLIDQKQKMSQKENEQIKEKIEEAVCRQITLFDEKKRKVFTCA
jgi:glutamyl-tRNA reductase